MAVPSYNLSKGFYFGSLNGKSDFQSRSWFQPAVDVSGLAYLFKDSTRTDLRSFAYMPQLISDRSWIGTSYRQFFEKSLPYSKYYAGGNWFKVKRANGQTYPVYIAEMGTRIRTDSFKYRTKYFPDTNESADMHYQIFSTQIYRTTSSGLSLRIASDGLWNGDSKLISWTRRKWIGLAGVAGGAGGGTGTWGNSAGGGSSGAFWFGIFDISSGSWTLSTSGRNIEVKKDGVTKIWVGSSGGSASTSGEGEDVITFRKSNGAGGGGATNGGGSQNISPWTAETPDQETVPFEKLRGGPSGSGGGGGGGSSVFGVGGAGGTRGNLFTGGNWNNLDGSGGYGSGAGGGGGCYTLWWDTNSGGGGAGLELVIGY